MHNHSDSTDRRPAEYIRFAFGFVGLVVGIAGIIVSSLVLALAGWLTLLLVVCSFRSSPED